MNNVGYCLSLIWNGILFLALNDDFGDISFIKENISTSLAVSSGKKTIKLGCVVRMAVDPHADFGQNNHRKDASPFIGMIRILNSVYRLWNVSWNTNMVNYCGYLAW